MEREGKDVRMNEAPGLRSRGSGSRGCSLTTVLRDGGCWKSSHRRFEAAVPLREQVRKAYMRTFFKSPCRGGANAFFLP